MMLPVIIRNVLRQFATKDSDIIKSPVSIFVCLVLISAFAVSCSAQSGGSSRSVVSVGEEVLFYADDFANIDSAKIPDRMHARYRWSFGDDVAPVSEGRSTTYTYLNPGSYTVTLDITPAIKVDDNGTLDDDKDDSWEFYDSQTVYYTKVITVEGDLPKLVPQVFAQPILSLPFEDSIADSSTATHGISWKDNLPGSFAPGLSGTALDLSGGKAIVIDTKDLLEGKSEFSISFRARKKDLTQPVNCIFWQPTTNSYQPAVRFIISDATSGSSILDTVTVYTTTTSGPVQTATYNITRDTNWHYYAFTFSVSTGESKLFVDGQLKTTKTIQAPLTTGTDKLYIGYGEQNTTDGVAQRSFNGYIDDFRVYDSLLSESEISSGFTVRHADFHGHTAQYILVSIPQQISCDNSNRLYATVSGGGLSNPAVLADKTSLQDSEKFILHNAQLPGSRKKYILAVQLRDASGSVLFEKKESFVKRYAGFPKVGIDENNAIRVNGELFFPVTPWGLNDASIATWADAGYINSLYGQGFWPGDESIDGYGEYLYLAGKKSLPVIGPAMWDGLGNTVNTAPDESLRYPFVLCSDLGKLRAYVREFKDNDAQQMWQWMDEPELYGNNANQLRAWTRASHDLDEQHIVATNVMGHPYCYTNDAVSSYWGKERHTFALGYNATQFGVSRSVVDVLGVDYYPLDAFRSNVTDTMNRLGTILDTIRTENLDLVPVFSYVETADAGNSSNDNSHLTPWKPSVEQLKMLTWFNVVHEAKGINWFHYFQGNPAENLSFMTTFTRQIKELAPAVLGPRLSQTVSCTISDSLAGRIDTMIREYNGKLYLIAVRVSEFSYQDNSAETPPPPAQNYDITATINIGSDVTDPDASVYEENRTVSVVNGIISDTFAPYAVHIYILN